MKRVNWWFVVSLALLLSAGCSRDPKVVRQRYVDNGNKYFDKGKYKEASIMYRRALQKDLRFGEAWYRLGLTNLKLGQYGEARRDFSRTTELEPNNVDGFVKLGDIDLAAYLLDPRGNRAALTELKEIIDSLFKKDPKSYDGLRLSGYVELTQRDLKKAIQSFEAADQVKPVQPDLVLSLVQTLFADNQPDAGEKYAKDLINKQKTYGPIYDVLYSHYTRTNRPELGEAILKQKIENNPKQGQYLVQLALHYYLTNRKNEMTSTLGRLTGDLKTFPNAHMLAGDFYFQIRDYANSVQQYEQGQKDDAKQKIAYQKRMVEVLSVEGKNDEAAKMVATLLKENPKDPESIAMHAALLLQSGNRDLITTVLNELQPLVAKLPNSPILHFNLGRAYLAKGDSASIEQARLQFQETLKLRPQYVPAKMALAQLELARGESSKAVQTADEIINLDNSNLGALLIRSMGLMNMGEKEKAREQLMSVTKAFPRSNDARYQLGLLNLSERRFKEAGDDFDALRQGQDPRGIIGIVEVEVAQGNYDKALNVVRDQLKQTPNRVDYQMAIANIEYRASRWADAANDYQKLIDKNPKSAELYLRLGETRRLSGDVNAGITAFKKAQELNPKDAMPVLQLGMLYDTNGRNDDARKCYEEVLKMQPDNPVALNNLAYAKADDGVDLDQALTFAQRAQQKRPDDLDVMDTLGLIYIKKNLTDEGVRVLKDLIVRKPDRALFHVHLAMAYYQKGDKKNARKELDTAARLKPSDRDQARIKEMMAKVG